MVLAISQEQLRRLGWNFQRMLEVCSTPSTDIIWLPSMYLLYLRKGWWYLVETAGFSDFVTKSYSIFIFLYFQSFIDCRKKDYAIAKPLIKMISRLWHHVKHATRREGYCYSLQQNDKTLVSSDLFIGFRLTNSLKIEKDIVFSVTKAIDVLSMHKSLTYF